MASDRVLAGTTIKATGAYDEAVSAIRSAPGFADGMRRMAGDTFEVLDQASSYVVDVFPDTSTAQRLGYDYSTQQGQIELNGARVRINAALDEFDSVPADELLSDEALRHIQEALIGGWDLVERIQERGLTAPGALDRVQAGAGVAGSFAGGFLTQPIAGALRAALESLWFYVAVAAGLYFFLVVRR